MQRSLSARLTDARLALTDALEGVWYSFAAQLFLFHFQSNPVLLAVWGLFAVMVSGGIGRVSGCSSCF